MAATGSVSLSATVTALPSGTKTVGPLTVSSAAANGNTIDQVLTANGSTTILIPPFSAASGIPGGATVTAMIIIPPAGNTTTMQFKGVAGDVGVPMSLTNPWFFSFGTTGTGTSFVITTVGAAITIEIVWI